MALIQRLQQHLQFNPYPSMADAAVLIAISQEDEPQIILTRRASHLHTHAGEVSLPGGKREVGDDDDSSVALREAQEEIGLTAQQVTLLGELPMQQSKHGLSVKPIVGLVPADVALFAQPDEIERIFKVKLHDVMYQEITPYQITYANQQIRVPSLILENEIIWGLTAKILVSLMQHGLQHHRAWPLVL